MTRAPTTWQANMGALRLDDSVYRCGAGAGHAWTGPDPHGRDRCRRCGATADRERDGTIHAYSAMEQGS